MLPILGSLFVSFCMVQLCTLISLPRIFLLLVERRPWETILSLPSVLDQILSLLLWSLGTGGEREFLPIYTGNVFLLLLSPSLKKKSRYNIEISQSTQNPHRLYEITVEKVTSRREIFPLKAPQAETLFVWGEITEEAQPPEHNKCSSNHQIDTSSCSRENLLLSSPL